MKKASKYCYVNLADEDEEIEFNPNEVQWSKDYNEIPQQQQQPQKPNPNAPTTDTKKKKFRQVDTNSLAVNFSSLVEKCSIATGDATMCSNTNCKAVFSKLSKLTPKEGEEGAKEWRCEFCNTSNTLQDFEEEEIPDDLTVDYIVGAPSTKTSTSTDSESILIYCLDISGSMCVTYELKEKVSLRGTQDLSKLNSTFLEQTQGGHQADQWLPNERRNVSYISRLQCLQGAISHHIEDLAKRQPNARVALMTFANEVTFYGDCSGQPIVVAGDRLSNASELIEASQSMKITLPVKESKEKIVKQLFSLTEGGATALGPAVLIGTQLLSKAPGNRMLVCTDGMSNIGVGALDDLVTEDEKDKAAEWYENLGKQAKQDGSTISVLTLKGTDCDVESLGAMADQTSGDIERFEPLDITKNFQGLLSLPVIATNVQARLLMHQGLYIINDEFDEEEGAAAPSTSSSSSAPPSAAPQDPNNQNNNTADTPNPEAVAQVSWVERDIGNVTQESTHCFEYAIKPDFKKQELVKDLKQLPIQLQIRYVRPSDGMRVLRVITDSQEITFSRQTAEECADVHVLGMNALQHAAKLAQKGEYSHARVYNMQNKALLSRAANTETKQNFFSNWAQLGERFENNIHQQQSAEAKQGLNYDDDMDFDDLPSINTNYIPQQEKLAKQKMVSKSRKQNRSKADDTSTMLYQMKNSHYVNEKITKPQFAPQQSVPQQSVPQQSAPQQSAPQQSASQQPAPQQSVPQQSAPQQSNTSSFFTNFFSKKN